MRKIRKWTKIIEKTENEINIMKRKLDYERKRQEVGEITKAELSKLKGKIEGRERELRAKIHRYQKMRVSRERSLKEKEKEREEKYLERRREKEEKKGSK